MMTKELWIYQSKAFQMPCKDWSKELQMDPQKGCPMPCKLCHGQLVNSEGQVLHPWRGAGGTCCGLYEKVWVNLCGRLTLSKVNNLDVLYYNHSMAATVPVVFGIRIVSRCMKWFLLPFLCVRLCQTPGIPNILNHWGHVRPTACWTWASNPRSDLSSKDGCASHVRQSIWIFGESFAVRNSTPKHQYPQFFYNSFGGRAPTPRCNEMTILTTE